MKARLAMMHIAVVASFIVLLTGCGGKVAGIYTGSKDSFFDSFNFKSGGKVDITFAGMATEGTFAVDGKQVKVSKDGETRIFTIDEDGCLDGGVLIGKYCSGNSRPSASNIRAPLLGVFRARDGEAVIDLNFLNDRKVTVTMTGEPNPSNGSYEIHGDKVEVTVPGGHPMELVYTGKSLTGTFGGHNIMFVKE